MQIQNPTHPDTSRHFSQIRPQLTLKQQNAVDLLIQGHSDRAVAEAVGVTRQTVCDWRNHNPAFIAELNRRRQDLWSSHADRLRRLADKAIKVLELDLMEAHPHPSESQLKLRQAAAVHILRACGLYGDNLLPEAETTDP